MERSGIYRKPSVDTVMARATLEAALVDIWKRVLGVSSISVMQNFFEIGGDALLAAAMICKAEEVTGKRLSVLSIFRAPTIQQLASAIVNGAAERGRDSCAA